MDIASLEELISSGRDSAMLRLALARLLARDDRMPEAIIHLEKVVTQDPSYTAAWKDLGRFRFSGGHVEAAIAAWRQGIVVAHARGDKQAEKEMRVFLRRAEKAQAGG